MSYIEREALLERLKRNLNACNPGTFSELCFRDAINTVTNFPAADVAQVVRCKDCKKFFNGTCRTLSERPDRLILEYQVKMPPDGFCYYGERKDGAE